MTPSEHERAGLASPGDLEAVFRAKYGSPETAGWSPARRHRSGYFTPADIYEAAVSRRVLAGCSWIDVGGGHDVFPNNPGLARELVSRCAFVAAVDPSANVHRNDFAHERTQCLIEDYRPTRRFDLATLRMVAEHVERPGDVVRALADLLRPGGAAVVFTVNRWSPLTLLSHHIPFGFHHAIKSAFWGGDEEDTFPVCYRMNTRSTLRRQFEAGGFREAAFAHLDDLSTFGRFRLAGRAELLLWRAFKGVGSRYPENCLLGVYEKRE
ncbi:MAG: class I SAM-dependent methyltransferase [Gemmataceae bacterium]